MKNKRSGFWALYELLGKYMLCRENRSRLWEVCWFLQFFFNIFYDFRMIRIMINVKIVQLKVKVLRIALGGDNFMVNLGTPTQTFFFSKSQSTGKSSHKKADTVNLLLIQLTLMPRHLFCMYEAPAFCGYMQSAAVELCQFPFHPLCIECSSLLFHLLHKINIKLYYANWSNILLGIKRILYL